MNWMETLSRYPWPLYLVVGLVAGFFVGYQVLPELRPRQDSGNYSGANHREVHHWR